jgi:sodium/potassium-transporting ATPase subunit alpha
MLLGVAGELVLILTIVYTPWGNDLFGTAPIKMQVWLFVIPFAVGMLIPAAVRCFAALIQLR